MEVIELSSDSEEEQSDSPVFELTVHGKPTALPRPRFFQRGIWNKAKPNMAHISQCARTVINTVDGAVLFPADVPVTMVIEFYTRRPLQDFVGNKRKLGNLRPQAAVNQFLPIGPDVDNLAKLVMDALNGIVYSDDRQVVVLETCKLRDNHGLCNGRTKIIVTKHKNRVL